jgi:hypothetical protein
MHDKSMINSAPPGRKRGKPVAVVKQGSTSVPIYRGTCRGANRFTLSSYQSGLRQRPTCGTIDVRQGGGATYRPLKQPTASPIVQIPLTHTIPPKTMKTGSLNKIKGCPTYRGALQRGWQVALYFDWLKVFEGGTVQTTGNKALSLG